MFGPLIVRAGDGGCTGTCARVPLQALLGGSTPAVRGTTFAIFASCLIPMHSAAGFNTSRSAPAVMPPQPLIAAAVGRRDTTRTASCHRRHPHSCLAYPFLCNPHCCRLQQPPTVSAPAAAERHSSWRRHGAAAQCHSCRQRRAAAQCHGRHPWALCGPGQREALVPGATEQHAGREQLLRTPLQNGRWIGCVRVSAKKERA